MGRVDVERGVGVPGWEGVTRIEVRRLQCQSRGHRQQDAPSVETDAGRTCSLQSTSGEDNLDDREDESGATAVASYDDV